MDLIAGPDQVKREMFDHGGDWNLELCAIDRTDAAESKMALWLEAAADQRVEQAGGQVAQAQGHADG